MVSDFLFADDDSEVVETLESNWKILIVDDEPEVHAVTKLALSDFSFQHKGLEFYSAYSGEEAKKLIHEHPDAAIILLDVVMETDDAGLRVAEYIRQQAQNNFVRIILRTGQPGQAPERQVIVNYDINDYKSKTELTAQKLFTVIMASLRSYRDIIAIEENRKGLEKIISASTNLFSIHSMESFISGIVQQLTSVISSGREAMYATTLVANGIEEGNGDLIVVAGQGDFADAEGKAVKSVLNEDMMGAFITALNNKEIVYGDDYVIAYCQSKSCKGSLLYIAGLNDELSPTDKHLIELFTNSVQLAYDNVLLTRDLEDTQREIVMRLSEAVECRSKETGNHVKRVSLYCRSLALKLGMSEDEADKIMRASPLHDLGKIGISDDILHKPAKLSDEERTDMKEHALLGFNLLQGSDRPLIKAGAIIAKDHHEKWDGSGYPEGKKGEDIHVYGRIVALADVYDALRNERCYKDAWPKQKVIDYIAGQAGKHFDPTIVGHFLDSIDEFEAILNKYPDQE
ncbi:metal-dependent phosphohydrolase [Saccharobesus litoralis]|uniref:Metal-dependent phosphohydrolase n=1 Tax=Saccharobesus litoralis TaxID=2172099 RepID=A0A2S0VU14_9ALTE|nr:DUF3369 domain-containing protein [Saccharobesus litoralis]AWB67698.1 metal-dependent phosphohydrolase [Saccharobesus litoralis]